MYTIIKAKEKQFEYEIKQNTVERSNVGTEKDKKDFSPRFRSVSERRRAQKKQEMKIHLRPSKERRLG